MASPVAAAVAQTLSAAVRELREGELVIETAALDLPSLASGIVSRLDGTLLSLFATDQRRSRGEFVVHHLWSLPRHAAFLRVAAPVDPDAAAFPSIAARHPAANWFEREISDFFGLSPAGHPNPLRVALHDDWPGGAWPLRKDFPEHAEVPRVSGESHPFRPVVGEGVFQVPVGPVHAGIIEPGHFRFGVAGEPVLYLQLRLFYVHKGTEKRFETLPWRHGIYLAESISGDTSVAHALAHAHAVERLCGVTAPPRADALRVLFVELERIYNHVADIGALATDVAFAVPASRAQVLRERQVRLQEQLFGTRLLRGTIAVGGVKRDLPSDGAVRLRSHVDSFAREFGALLLLLMDAGTFTDRIDGTGVLSRQAARDLGVVGMAARASGIDADLRRDHPYDAYSRLQFDVPVEEGGDVRARLMIRAREIEQSIALVRHAMRLLHETAGGAIASPMPDRLPANASALGWVEGWRGPITHWMATGANGEIARVKITDPSFLNWPAVAHAVPGNIIPDFPVINKSFNLSYSGNDR